jgi:hypothetical protein
MAAQNKTSGARHNCPLKLHLRTSPVTDAREKRLMPSGQHQLAHVNIADLVAEDPDSEVRPLHVREKTFVRIIWPPAPRR